MPKRAPKVGGEQATSTTLGARRMIVSMSGHLLRDEVLQDKVLQDDVLQEKELVVQEVSTSHDPQRAMLALDWADRKSVV